MEAAVVGRGVRRREGGREGGTGGCGGGVKGADEDDDDDEKEEEELEACEEGAVREAEEAWEGVNGWEWEVWICGHRERRWRTRRR